MIHEQGKWISFTEKCSLRSSASLVDENPLRKCHSRWKHEENISRHRKTILAKLSNLISIVIDAEPKYFDWFTRKYVFLLNY